MDEFISTYLPEPASRTHHHASPLLAPPPSRRAAAPHAPALVLLCQCDLLQPQGLRYADKLRAEGCDVQVSVPGCSATVS
jgi:acetyl esterase/lipase